jgi:hypothetical protein
LALLGSRSRALIGAALTTLTGVAVACSAGSFNSGAVPFADGGSPALSDGGSYPASDGGGGSDSGVPGTSEDASPGDSGAVFAPIPLLAVHASANLYDFRLCFGVLAGGVSSILPVPAYPDDPSHPVPETNYPGVPVGGAAMLPALALAGTQVTPYVVRAQLLDKLGYLSTNVAEPTCDQLICTGGSNCLTAQLDYFPLAPVTVSPSGGAPLVLAIEGCGPSGVGAASIAQCGPGYTTSSGNLSAQVAQVAPPSALADGGGSWTIQPADLSPSFAAFASDDGGSPTLTYVDPTTDASVALSVAAGSINVASSAVPLSDAGVTSAYFTVGSSLTQSLVSIQYFQAPSSDPYTYFTAPVTYFTAILGDATDAAAPASLLDGAANPAFDGHGLHVIAYPTSVAE